MTDDYWRGYYEAEGQQRWCFLAIVVVFVVTVALSLSFAVGYEIGRDAGRHAAAREKGGER